MQVLIHNQKGGAGKTMLATHLSVALTRHGSVAVCDLDDVQGSITAWLAARAAAGLHDLVVVRDPASSDCDFVVIDTPPAASAHIAERIRQAGMILIPVKPGSFDSHAVRRTVAMLQAAGAVDKTLFVINAVTSKAKAKVLRSMLTEAGVNVWPGELGHYERFDDAIPQGKGVNEAFPGSTASHQINDLLDYIKQAIL